MKALFSPKHTRDVLVYSFIAGDKWRKVKRNHFCFTQTQILFFTDTQELILLSNSHGIHIPLVAVLNVFQKMIEPFKFIRFIDHDINY